MFNIVLIVHCVLCFALIGLVLLQQGKGADIGANLSGGSDTLFGAGGATDFITKLTTGLAVAFMASSIMLVRFYNKPSVSDSADSVLEGSVFPDESAGKTTVESIAIKPTSIANPETNAKESSIKKEKASEVTTEATKTDDSAKTKEEGTKSADKGTVEK
jgi:protein translocase SecG subunit